MTEHEWQTMRNRWARGIDWCVEKVGAKWRVSRAFGEEWRLFDTKTEAGEAVDAFIIETARARRAAAA